MIADISFISDLWRRGFSGKCNTVVISRGALGLCQIPSVSAHASLMDVYYGVVKPSLTGTMSRLAIQNLQNMIGCQWGPPVHQGLM
jgi:hypothetical protein